MLSKDEVIVLIVLGGTVLMFLILVFFLIFVFMYQRRNARYRLSLVQIELERQQELITANAQIKQIQLQHRKKLTAKFVGTVFTNSSVCLDKRRSVNVAFK